MKRFIESALVLNFILVLMFLTGMSPRETIVAFGDSNTAGSNWKENDYNEKEKWINKLRIEYNVYNAGKSGNTTEQARKRFEKDVLEREPNIVTIMFGTNDAVLRDDGNPRVNKFQFEQNIIYFIDKLKAKNIQVILMTTFPVIEGHQKGYYYARHTESLYVKHGGVRKWHNSYNEIIRGIAKKKHIILIDNYQNAIAHAKGQTDKDLIHSGLFDKTGTHLSPEGADLIYKSLSKTLQ